jgi:hypothetical protein
MMRGGTAFAACMLLFQGANSFAADPSVMRVAVVPSAGQMSLVIELSDEARSVSTQQVTPTLLLVEAGPIALPLKRQIMNAPSGLALLQKVSVDEGTTGSKEHVLRLGVTMKRPAPSTVRVAGRRVYIDFMVADAPGAVAPPRAAASTSIPLQQRQSRLTSNRNAALALAAPAPAAPAPAAGRQALTGATSRLEEIQPFLLSATSAPVPNPAVLNAVADAIGSVQQSLRGVQPPAKQGPSFQLLVSAASLAAEAVSADFHGDRASKAKQSIAVLAAAKAQLQ